MQTTVDPANNLCGDILRHRETRELECSPPDHHINTGTTGFGAITVPDRSAPEIRFIACDRTAPGSERHRR